MPGASLPDIRDHYDVVVIGGGLGGMTAANALARAGHSVLLAEHHYKLGGLATWFRRGRRAHVRRGLARLPGGHDQELPPLLERRDRRFHRPAQGHPLRQPDVLALDQLRPPGFHAAVGRTVPRSAGKRRAVLRRRPEHELLRRSGDDHRPAFRALLSRPWRRRAAADGADHLRQRLDAGRPGPELRHRVLQLHVQGRLHLPERHRAADPADGRGTAAQRRRCPHAIARSSESTSPADGSTE